MRLFAVLSMLLHLQPAMSQSDTVSFPWPVPPASSYQHINGTFSEYRNTLSANHFHSGTDIGQPDGLPVYPSISGVVHSLSSSAASGSNAWVRIRSQVPGGWKHISYVHIEPAPGLSAGDPVVAGSTVIGTILSRLGHVHFTEREILAEEFSSGVEINSIRSSGGLTPYTDSWAPAFISTTLQFRRAGSRSTISPMALNGRVDIVVQVMERNSPESLRGTRTNNGTYALGYRILSADSQTTVFEPPDAGMRYLFDRKPNNSYVGNVFDEAVSTTSAHHYYVTNGAGASSVNSTRSVLPNWFDADQLPAGPYVLHLFTSDTRGNTTDWYVSISVTDQDLSPPGSPTLLSAVPDGEDIVITWLPPTDPDLGGYRLYVHSALGGDFVVPETTLTKNVASYRLRLPADFPAPDSGLPRVELRLTAVDTVAAPNESQFGDTYAASPGMWKGRLPGRKYLIVDGFDRYGGSGSWLQPIHTFALSVAQQFPSHVAVGSAVNELVEGGTVIFSDYDLVQWILGDESTADNTFTSAEQFRVKQYLESGGSLIVSGSEVGWDLGRSHNASEPGDLAFYTDYLKAQYIFDGNTSMTSATGVAGTPFQGYTWTFGQVFPEDYPDDIEPVGGAVTILTYNSQRDAQTFQKAGVGYIGPFGQSASIGRLIYLAFPFESLVFPLTREVMFQKSLEFMGVTTSVSPIDVAPDVPGSPEVFQNYPNPFNPATTISFALPAAARVSVKVYDVLGRELEVLVNADHPSGRHAVQWDASGFASGIYLLRMEVGSVIITQRMILLK